MINNHFFWSDPCCVYKEEFPELPADIFAQMQTDKSLYLKAGLLKLQEYISQPGQSLKKLNLTECLDSLTPELLEECIEFLESLKFGEVNLTEILKNLQEALPNTTKHSNKDLSKLSEADLSDSQEEQENNRPTI